MTQHKPLPVHANHIKKFYDRIHDDGECPQHQCCVHEATLEWLLTRLHNGRRYDTLLEKVKGKSQGYEFEFDAIAIKGLTFHYYEVKSRYSEKSVARAIKQFENARHAYPDRKWKFIIVTPEHIEIYRPGPFKERGDPWA